MSRALESQLHVACGREALFAALTQTSQLEAWFCERAEIDLEAKRYDFWGRYTPGAPTSEHGSHPLVAHEPLSRLAFEWSLRGANTRVELELAEDSAAGGPRTLLRLAHRDLPDRQRNEAALSDFWDGALENLRGWVERQTVGIRADFSRRAKDPVELAVEVQKSPEEVFRALIDPQQVSRYIGEGVKIEPRVGGRYDVGWQVGGPVKILELEPGKRLKYSWQHEGEPDTVVTWELAGSGGGTRLMLVHSGFGDDDVCDPYDKGWIAFLNRIKCMLEKGETWRAPAQGHTDYAASAECV